MRHVFVFKTDLASSVKAPISGLFCIGFQGVLRMETQNIQLLSETMQNRQACRFRFKCKNGVKNVIMPQLY